MRVQLNSKAFAGIIAEDVDPVPFDRDLDMTVWSSNLLDADYYEDTPENWVEARYAIEIALNETLGWVSTKPMTPAFTGGRRNNPRRWEMDPSLCYGRSRHHTLSRGWKRYSPTRNNGRDSIRKNQAAELPDYDANDFLEEQPEWQLGLDDYEAELEMATYAYQ